VNRVSTPRDRDGCPACCARRFVVVMGILCIRHLPPPWVHVHNLRPPIRLYPLPPVDRLFSARALLHRCLPSDSRSRGEVRGSTNDVVSGSEQSTWRHGRQNKLHRQSSASAPAVRKYFKLTGCCRPFVMLPGGYLRRAGPTAHREGLTAKLHQPSSAASMASPGPIASITPRSPGAGLECRIVSFNTNSTVGDDILPKSRNTRRL
jgi:hypothetical protein